MTEQRSITVSGPARAPGISRNTLIAYKVERPEYVDSIHSAYAPCLEIRRVQLVRKSASSAAFSLKTTGAGANKSEVDHTSRGESLMPVVRIIDERATTRNPDSE